MRAAALSASLLLSGVLASSHPISQEGAPEPPAARLERERDTDIEGRRGLSEILHDLDPLGHFGLEGGRGGRKSVHPLPRAAAAAAPAAPADKKKKEKSKHKHKHKHKAKPKPATTAPAATTTSAAAAASSTTAAAPAATTSAAPSPAEVQAQKDEATLQEVSSAWGSPDRTARHCGLTDLDLVPHPVFSSPGPRQPGESPTVIQHLHPGRAAAHEQGVQGGGHGRHGRERRRVQPGEQRTVQVRERPAQYFECGEYWRGSGRLVSFWLELGESPSRVKLFPLDLIIAIASDLASLITPNQGLCTNSPITSSSYASVLTFFSADSLSFFPRIVLLIFLILSLIPSLAHTPLRTGA